MEQLLKAGNGMVKHALWVLALGALIGYASVYFAGASAGPVRRGFYQHGRHRMGAHRGGTRDAHGAPVGFFYGGMVSAKNVVNVLKQSLIILALVSVQWVVLGYSLVFGADVGGVIGNLNFFRVARGRVAPDANYAGTIPALVFMIFQGMFAIITPALIIGAFVERIRFSTLVIFTLLWTALVYDPSRTRCGAWAGGCAILAHWISREVRSCT